MENIFNTLPSRAGIDFLILSPVVFAARFDYFKVKCLNVPSMILCDRISEVA